MFMDRCDQVSPDMLFHAEPRIMKVIKPTAFRESRVDTSLNLHFQTPFLFLQRHEVSYLASLAQAHSCVKHQLFLGDCSSL